MLDTETRHPTPETYINYRCAYCPAGATYSERRHGKSLDSMAEKLSFFTQFNAIPCCLLPSGLV